MTLLFTVEDTFELTGRGCVLAPGPSIEVGAPEVKAGDLIKLLLPSGEVFETQVRELLNMKRLVRPEVLTIPLLLPKNVSKHQVPKGTRVFLVATDTIGRKNGA